MSEIFGVPNFARIGLDHFIGEDAGEIRLDRDSLPGILQRMTIRAKLRLDTAGSLFGEEKKQPTGFTGARVFVTLALPSGGSFLGPALGGSVETCYDLLEALNEWFRAVDGDGNAKIWQISNAQISARGIKEVWFSTLESSEAHRDVIIASLEFTEPDPPKFGAELGLTSALEALADGDIPA